MNYQDYLQSEEWKTVAEAVKERAGYRCQVCNSDHRLVAHHRTYAHKGDEINHLDDLTCLCDRCHRIFHAPQKLNGVVTATRMPDGINKNRSSKTNDDNTEYGVIVTTGIAGFLTVKNPAYAWLEVNGFKPKKSGWKGRLIGKWVPLFCIRGSRRKSLKALGLLVKKRQ